MKNQLSCGTIFIVIVSICFGIIGCNNFKTEKVKTTKELRNELKIQEESNPKYNIKGKNVGQYY